jgi:predicted RNase H-like HicB family nuclease
MSRYAVVFELTDSGRNWSAYVPDLPGCVATGKTREACEKLIHEAIEFHIEGLKIHEMPVPEPSAQVGYVEAA